jgi:GTP1/Obg family GTP-binding protein
MDAQRVGEELERIRLDNEDGILYTEDVADYARAHARAAIRGAFEWDTRKAIGLFHRSQARDLIRAVRIRKKNEFVRVFHSLEGKGYRNIADILASEPMTMELLSKFLKDATTLTTRYDKYQALVPEIRPVIKAVDKLKKKHRTKLRQKRGIKTSA